MYFELNEEQKYKIINYKTKRLGSFNNKKSSPKVGEDFLAFRLYRLKYVPSKTYVI